ncbi:MAG: nitroreductase/quinone reductase family protein [Acidimicrobiia bacterium]
MPLTDADLEGLASTQTIDLTTFGKRSGLPRRIEIWWFNVDGRFFITGTPGKRDWLANVLADPRVIIHVNGLEIEATASLVADEDSRILVLAHPSTRWYSTQAELDELVRSSPMVEVHLPTG